MHHARVSEQIGEQAAFYRSAVLLGLMPGRDVVAWADAIIAAGGSLPAEFYELATTSPDDISRLRDLLFPLCISECPPAAVTRVLALVASDFTSGRRSYTDTLTVLRQVRGFLKLPPELADEIRSLQVALYEESASGGGTTRAEQRLRDWLTQHA